MKYICIICLLLIANSLEAQTSFTTLNNQSVNLNSLSGKRIVIIILPTQNDTSVAHQLVNFQNKFGDIVRVIGLVCLNSCNVSSEAISSIYQDGIDAGVLITTGTTTADSSSTRETVIKWLSDRSANSRSTEPGIIGTKYFLSKTGKIYAQLGAYNRLDSKLVENIVRTKVPKEN